MLTLKKLAGGVATTALIMAMAGAAAAQETTSAIRGAVTDAGGAPVAGARVTILHTPSGTRSTTSTDDSGNFDARGLRVGGPYQITVEGTGFEPETLEGVNLTLGETARLNFDVAGADEVEAVVVTAARVTDPTADNSGVASTLAREDIEQVVSVNRDIRDLARRNLLVSQNTRGDGGISIAGSNPRNNRITIDGAQAQDEFGLNTGGLPTQRGPVSLEAIEQFTVDAVPIDVENGNFSGGALNLVLRSGGNNFKGALFLNYLNDGLVGDSIRDRPVGQPISQENYGGFLSGPLIRDKLFFAVSYEFYESVTRTATGPTGSGFANDIRGVTQADIDRVVGIFDASYASDFNPGEIVRTTPVLDEKYTVKLDYNINDNHRASFTARYALSEQFTRTNLGINTAALNTQYYLTGEEDYTYAAEVNSDWTDNFSTQIRITYRDLERRQQSIGGDEFADIIVCLAPTSNTTTDTNISCGNTSSLRFGPDEFRQANFLETSNARIQAKGEYSLGDHFFKFGYEGAKQDVFNLFVPTSDGVYYFDSVADFQAGRANQLRYNNAITGNPNDAAADFAFFTHSLYAQDTFEVTPELRFTAGARFDYYTSDDRPAENLNFVRRQGFSNQETFDGKSIFMPRFAFEYEPTDYLDIRGGFGLFSGGLPNVILSNSFSNTGVLTSGIEIRRNNDGTFVEQTGAPGFSQAVGAAALNINRADPRFGFDIPAAVLALQGGAIVSPLSETNALLPGFQPPSEYKFFLTTSLEAPEGWSDSFAPTALRPVLEGWRLTLDAVATRANQGFTFRDFRARPLVVNGQQALTPDGRIRYDNIGGTAAQRAAAGITSVSAGGNNRDIVAFNVDEGESYTVGLSLTRSFDNGIDLLLGYARQDIEDRVSGARFGSTANSLYGVGPAGLDPNEEAFGTGFEEIKNRYKFEVGYRRDLFRDLETRFNLFGEARSGRPVSFVMGVPGGGRSTTFGVNRANHLFYVPDFANDANPNDLNVGIVTFADAATRDRVRNTVEFFGLEGGRIVGKGEGSDDQPEIYQLDLQFSQQLPGVFRGRPRLVFDLQNVLNLINNEWGLVEEFSDTNRVVDVQCADANGVAAAVGSPVCARYRYSNASTTATTRTIDTNNRSVWQLQIGIRYEF
jgi:outer membrane receptor for ferrienterochelin and colicin